MSDSTESSILLEPGSPSPPPPSLHPLLPISIKLEKQDQDDIKGETWLFYHILAFYKTTLDDSQQMSLGPADLVSLPERQHRDLQMLMLKQIQLKQFQAHSVPAWATQAQLVSRCDLKRLNNNNGYNNDLADQSGRFPRSRLTTWPTWSSPTSGRASTLPSPPSRFPSSLSSPSSPDPSPLPLPGLPHLRPQGDQQRPAGVRPGENISQLDLFLNVCMSCFLLHLPPGRLSSLLCNLASLQSCRALCAGTWQATKVSTANHQSLQKGLNNFWPFPS